MPLIEDQEKLKALTVGLIESLVCIESAVLAAANQGSKINGGISSVRTLMQIGLSEFDLAIHFSKANGNLSTSIEVDLDAL